MRTPSLPVSLIQTGTNLPRAHILVIHQHMQSCLLSPEETGSCCMLLLSPQHYKGFSFIDASNPPGLEKLLLTILDPLQIKLPILVNPELHMELESKLSFQQPSKEASMGNLTSSITSIQFLSSRFVETATKLLKDSVDNMAYDVQIWIWIWIQGSMYNSAFLRIWVTDTDTIAIPKPPTPST